MPVVNPKFPNSYMLAAVSRGQSRFYNIDGKTTTNNLMAQDGQPILVQPGSPLKVQ